ncbi:MAG: tetratricopeptide repeat protein [Prevotellaceae bacterium]|jgi:tetratricopeptide (TPR) repeat protein|nr:tetratricopeptide repeat protein [Prevotellaceae bacterium]
MEENSFFPFDETTEIVRRYEDFCKGRATGYFDVDELSYLVDYYLVKGMTAECTEVLELGKKLHPNSEELSLRRAKTFFVKGDYTNAMKVLDTIANTADYETSILRIELLQCTNRTKEAQMLANKLFADESDDATDDNEVICMDIANAFITQGNRDIGMKWLQKGERINPQNIDLLLEKAIIHENREEYTKALEIYDRIIEIDAFVAEVWFNLGQMHHYNGNYQLALEAYNYAAALDDEDMLTCLQRAHVLFQLDKYEEAIELYSEYGEKTGDTWQTNIFVAECYEQMEEYDKSMEFFQKSLEKYPDNYDALIGIAICLLAKEQYIESIKYTELALEIEKDEAEAWVYLAEALVGLDKIAYALLAYTKAIVLDPKQPDTLMAMAGLMMEEDKFEHALELYRAAQQLNNSLELIDLFIAICYFYTDNNSMGVHCLRIAITKDPRTKELFVELCPELKCFLDEI